jgi:tRNA threonylcarbamoyladenosine biosynthesis protein TsaB
MLLAIDTSTRAIGLALYDGVQVLSETVWVSQDYHTVELAPAVREMFKKCDVQVSALKALAVALGPGSFTGLRIGLALVKGMSLAHHLPLIGVPTLDILAAAQPLRDEPMAAVLHAGRGRLAVGWYLVMNGRWQQTGKIEALTPQELHRRIKKPTLVCGELTQSVRGLLERKRVNVISVSPAQCVRRPAYLAELGWQRWEAGQVDDPAILSPIYLHHHDPIPG